MPDDPEVLILAPRRGRPRASDPTTPASTRLPTSDYDRIVRLAVRHDIPVSAFIRELVQLSLRDFPY